MVYKFTIDVAPFTGAWIEIDLNAGAGTPDDGSHPSRVRGLKYRKQQGPQLRAVGRTLHGCVD